MPNPGLKSRRHREENARALGLVLTAGELMRIEEAAPKAMAAGARYPEVATRTLED